MAWQEIIVKSGVAWHMKMVKTFTFLSAKLKKLNFKKKVFCFDLSFGVKFKVKVFDFSKFEPISVSLRDTKKISIFLE